MKQNQKAIRKAATGLHGLTLVLIVGIFLVQVYNAPETLKTLLILSALICFIAEGLFLIRYIKVSNEMESDLSRSQVELLQQQLQSNEERLKALQSQINPHFLYNTLETIRGMALEKNEKELARIISSLSLMFR